jgi:hypothetical protein
MNDNRLAPDDDPEFLANVAQGPLVRAARAYLHEHVDPGASHGHGQEVINLGTLRHLMKVLIADVTALIRTLAPLVERNDPRAFGKMDWNGPLSDAALGELLRHCDRTLAHAQKPTDPAFIRFVSDGNAMMIELLAEARALRTKLLAVNGGLWDPKLPR